MPAGPAATDAKGPQVLRVCARSGRRRRANGPSLTPAIGLRQIRGLSFRRGAALKLGLMLSMDTGRVRSPQMTAIRAGLRDDPNHMPQAKPCSGRVPALTYAHNSSPVRPDLWTTEVDHGPAHGHRATAFGQHLSRETPESVRAEPSGLRTGSSGSRHPEQSLDIVPANQISMWPRSLPPRSLPPQRWQVSDGATQPHFPAVCAVATKVSGAIGHGASDVAMTKIEQQPR